jgi:hypothetical protein
MFKKFAVSTFFYLLFPLSAFSGVGNDLSKADNLVFRFTGLEAQELTSFLKERVRREIDYDQTRYYGERMSLACSEHDDCYLWLSRKEWKIDGNGAAASSVLTFTLPLKQNTWSGRLSLSAAASQNESTVQLQLRDLYYPGTFVLTRSLNCPVVKGETQPGPLQGHGDCRLELSSAPKKGLSYPASLQFIHNLDNIVLNFTGPWARKLFEAAVASEVDPHDPKRIRAQLGPELYCWNLDPLEQDPFLDDSYVCQTNLLRQDSGNVRFSGQGTMKGNRDFSLILKPRFRNGLLQDFDLLFHTEAKDWTITHCPSYGKNSGYGQCSIFYDMKINVGLYPIGDSVQGVAVGWGVTKQTR